MLSAVQVPSTDGRACAPLWGHPQRRLRLRVGPHRLLLRRHDHRSRQVISACSFLYNVYNVQNWSHFESYVRLINVIPPPMGPLALFICSIHGTVPFHVCKGQKAWPLYRQQQKLRQAIAPIPAPNGTKRQPRVLSLFVRA